MITDTGEQYNVHANWVHNNNLDNWKDWLCAAGRERIFIDDNLDIYSSECLNDYLGNIDSNWAIFNNDTVCKQSRCTGCTDDLILSKRKNNEC